MKHLNYVLILAALLSFGAAIFQVAIGIVPEWSAYWEAGDALVSTRALLLGSSLIVTLAAAVVGLYALSGVGLIQRLPLLRIGLFVVGSLCTLSGITFAMLLTVLGILPSHEPILAI
jgi:hypothetical protein